MALNQEAQPYQGINLNKSLVKRTPGSKSEIGMMYQYAVTVFLAGKLSANDNVEDYVIYSSEASAGKFDDVIMRVRLKDPNNCYLCLVQVKHKEEQQLSFSRIEKRKPDKHLLPCYINSFNKIMTDTSLLCRHGIPNENIQFGIVTNKSIQVPVILPGQHIFEVNLEAYSEEGIHKTLLPFEGGPGKFACEDSAAVAYQNFFEGCYIYANQPSDRQIKEDIKIICEIDNANEIVDYVRDYFNDDSLHKQGLGKDQFKMELLKIRFANSIIPLSQPTELINEELIDIWNKITLEQDITIASNEKDAHIETCLLSCWAQNVISLLNLEIDRNDLICSRSLDKNIIEKFKKYSQGKEQRFWLSVPSNFKSLLIELWKYGELPLILKTKSKLDAFTKWMQPKRKYVILDDFTKRTKEIAKINSGVKLFSHIGNIDCVELQNSLLQNLKVSLQGHKVITMKTLLRDDIELMKTFTCADIIGVMKRIVPYVKEYYVNANDYLAFLIEDDTIQDGVEFEKPKEVGDNIIFHCNNKEMERYITMITTNPDFENYTICCLRRNKHLELIRGDLSGLRNCFNDEHSNPVYYSNEDKFVPVIGRPIRLEKHNYISRCLRKATIRHSYFELEQRQICLVLGDNYSDSIGFIEININDTKIEPPKKKGNFIKVTEENRRTYWDKLSVLTYPLLEVVIKEGKKELLRYRNCDNLSNYIIYEGEAVSEEEIFREVETGCNKVTIITGEPGIGKTSLLNSFCNFSDTKDYILFYDLQKFQTDLRQNKKILADPVEYIFENFRKESSQQFQAFIRRVFENKNIILVLDSFDEIVSVCETEVLKLLSILANDNIRLVIASRLNGCNILMRKFEVCTVNLEPLNPDDVSNYLTKWKINENTLEEFPIKFTANPLYLGFLRLIAEDSQQFSDITRFQLYENVIRKKVNRYLSRNSQIVSELDEKNALALHDRFALEVIFGKEKIEEKLECKPQERTNDYTKYGIITNFDDDGNPTFYHFTFVEFLVARWIVNAKDIKKYKDVVSELYQQLCQDNKIYILDILSEHLKPHQAVLQLDICKVKKLHARDPNCWKIVDDLGRNALHLATIRCKFSSGQYAPYRILETIIRFMQRNRDELDNRDVIIEKNWIDYIVADMFEYLSRYKCIETLKIYLSYKRRSFSDGDTGFDLFPLSHVNFKEVFSFAIKYVCIGIIRDLVFLQNRKNNTFVRFHQKCSLSCARSSPSWTNLGIQGNLSPLHIASIYGSEPMVKHLVNERDEVNVADAYRCTPLHYSSMLNALDSTTSNCDSTKNASMAIMRTLLKNGANVNTRNECGDTPFHTSVKTNNPIAVDNLLYNEYVNGEKACKLRDIDNQNQKGNTPLHLAIKVENQDIIKLLLVKGANVNTMNHKRETPFGIAIRKGNKDIINKLEPYFNINYRYPIYQMTYLHYAVETKNSDFVFYLLERGADANARDKGNWTPLHYSVKEWNTGITQMLLNKGADVFAEDNDSKTPLHYALENKNLELFRLLSQQNSNRLYPLHFAVISQNVNLIKQLVNKGQPNLFFGNDNTTCYSKGVDINITDNNGRTPLHFAVNCCQDSEIPIFLIGKGAKVNSVDNNGSTPLHLLIDSCQSVEIAKLLINKGADIRVVENSRIYINTKSGFTRKEIIQYIGGKGTDIDIPVDDGYRWYGSSQREPFHHSFVTVCSKLEIAHCLIEKGADINASDKHGRTPFYQSINYSDKRVIKLLIEEGANINKADNNGITPLHLAVGMKKKEIYKLLIENGADINSVDNYGQTPLHTSIEYSHIEVIKMLIERGANINTADYNCITPLHCTASLENPEACKWLIENGADINAVDNYGQTPLYKSIEYSHTEVIKVLIERGANINTADYNCITPLHCAASLENREACKCLIENGADINAADNYGRTPLYEFIAYSDIEITKLVIEKGANINKSDNNGSTPLHLAVGMKNKEIYKLLIENGADINAADNYGRTPLYKPIDYSDTEVIKSLIKRGAYINIADHYGITPLHYAASLKSGEAYKVLIENGAEINAVDRYGRTPLYETIAYSNIEITKLMIEKGANINKADNNSSTLLHSAVNVEDKEVYKLLIEKGANINAADNCGRTPIYGSINYSNIGVTKILIENGADINKVDNKGIRPLHCAFGVKDKEIYKLLIDNGADIHPADKEGRTPLYQSTKYSDREITKLLIERGADINKADNNGITPLHWAVSVEDKEIYKLLIEKGANINAADNCGRTPLYESIDYSDIVVTRILIENGADINKVDNKGITPLHCAVGVKDEEIYKLLIEKGANINATDEKGRTPLYQSIIYADIEVTKLLIEKGADINKADNNGITPLHRTVGKKSKEIHKVLIEKGAYFNALDNYGPTPLNKSIKYSDKAVTKLLIEKGAYINKPDNNGITPLHEAVWVKNIEMCKLLIEKGAEINKATNNDITLFHEAVCVKDIEICKLLFEKGADINKATNNGITPLHWAVRVKDIEICKFLIEKCADINKVDKWGITPLLQAVSVKVIDICKLLIEKGANIDKANYNGITPLHWAVRVKDIEICKFLIEKGADINKVDKWGITPLLQAVRVKDIEISKLLIEKGADINKATNNDITPLHEAVRVKDIEICKLLIEKGADINKATNNDTILLHGAIGVKDIEIYKLLIEKGADINKVTNNDITPLHEAVRVKDIEICKLLIEKGADINKATNNDITPLYGAIGVKDIEICRFLIEKGADINKATNNDITPLHEAVRVKDIEICKLLIAKGADINKATNNDITLLYEAVRVKDIEICKLLIEKGADINKVTNNDITPLHEAVRVKDIEICKLLIEKGADINKATNYDSTPLHWAVRVKDIEICKLLIAKGADINKATNNDITLLYEAVRVKDTEICKLLIEKGADINKVTNNDITPLHEAVRVKDIEICKLLIEKGADINKAANNDIALLYEAVRVKDIEICKLLIEKGADTNKATTNDITPLHWAVRVKDIKICKLLIENGADINKVTNNDIAPLHWAVRVKDIEICKLLIEKGADINKATNNDSTPLHWAVRVKSIEICKLLIEKGANMNKVDNKGITPLHEAVSLDEEVYKLLLENGAEISAADKIGRTPLSESRNSEITPLKNRKYCVLL